MSDRVTVRWNGNRQLVGWDEAGHSVVMDASPNYKGEGTGTRPLQLFLDALAGCTAMDVLSILEKKRQDVRGLEVEVSADQREAQPRIYTEIRLHYKVSGFGVDEKAVSRAIQLSEEKYCSVGGMLGPQSTVVTSYEITDARSAGVSLFEARGDE